MRITSKLLSICFPMQQRIGSFRNDTGHETVHCPLKLLSHVSHHRGLSFFSPLATKNTHNSLSYLSDRAMNGSSIAFTFAFMAVPSKGN